MYFYIKLIILISESDLINSADFHIHGKSSTFQLIDPFSQEIDTNTKLLLDPPENNIVDFL